MFTGIVQAQGQVLSLERRQGDLRMELQTPESFLDGCQLGDSIAVDGACLTVVTMVANRFAADVSLETTRKTIISSYATGTVVNLEPALRVGDALGGHYVSGHVDVVSELMTRSSDARSECMRFALPAEIAGLVASKGSITINGVSLTVNSVDHDWFEVNVVPHTLEVTTLGALTPGQAVNLEADILARYAARLLSTNNPIQQESPSDGV